MSSVVSLARLGCTVGCTVGRAVWALWDRARRARRPRRSLATVVTAGTVGAALVPTGDTDGSNASLSPVSTVSSLTLFVSSLSSDCEAASALFLCWLSRRSLRMNSVARTNGFTLCSSNVPPCVAVLSLSSGSVSVSSESVCRRRRSPAAKTRRLQTGHTRLFCVSHGSMHTAWYACAQGRTRSRSPSW